MKIFPGPISYFCAFAVVLIDTIWISKSQLIFPLRQLTLPLISTALLLFLALALARVKPQTGSLAAIFSKLGYILQGFVFMQFSWVAIKLLNHVSMTELFPYADERFWGWDKAIGLDWVRYKDFLFENPLLMTVLGCCYTSLSFLSLVAFLLLSFYGDLERSQRFVETYFLTALACVTIGMFFPALGPMATYLGSEYTHANIHHLPGVYSVLSIEKLRSGAAFALDIAKLPGLVTFPSFHTAAGIILMLGFRSTPLWPFVTAYVILMIASTPVYGSHYFVDLLAGAGVALLVHFAVGFFSSHMKPARDRAPYDDESAGEYPLSG